MRRGMRVALLAMALALVVLAAGPPLVSAITAALLARGTLEEPVKIRHQGIQLKTKGPTDVGVNEVRFAPGDVQPWHYHPGFAIVTVKSGTITIYDQDCRPHPIEAGKAHVETATPHQAVNEGTAEAHFYVTVVVPQGSPQLVFTNPPDCATGGDRDEDSDGEEDQDDEDKR